MSHGWRSCRDGDREYLFSFLFYLKGLPLCRRSKPRVWELAWRDSLLKLSNIFCKFCIAVYLYFRLINGNFDIPNSLLTDGLFCGWLLYGTMVLYKVSSFLLYFVCFCSRVACYFLTTVSICMEESPR